MVLNTGLKIVLIPLLICLNVLFWQWASTECPLFQPFWVHKDHSQFIACNWLGFVCGIISCITFVIGLFFREMKG